MIEITTKTTVESVTLTVDADTARALVVVCGLGTVHVAPHIEDLCDQHGIEGGFAGLQRLTHPIFIALVKAGVK